VHDIARVLHISPLTVLAMLRVAEQTPEPPEPSVRPRTLDLEVAEQSSFV
jgi:hypothetical protein